MKSAEEISPTFTLLARFSILEDSKNKLRPQEWNSDGKCTESAKICQALKECPNYTNNLQNKTCLCPQVLQIVCPVYTAIVKKCWNLAWELASPSENALRRQAVMVIVFDVHLKTRQNLKKKCYSKLYITLLKYI